MRKHDIIMQCGKVRLAGDLNEIPKLYEVNKCNLIQRNNSSYWQYECRYVKNGLPAKLMLFLNDVEPLPSKQDLDILNARNKKRLEQMQPVAKAIGLLVQHGLDSIFPKNR